MASQILKEFLVAVGFKVDENSYRRQREAVEKTTRVVRDLDKSSQGAHENEQRRADRQKSTYADLATAANLWGRTLARAADGAAEAMKRLIAGFDQYYFVSRRVGASTDAIKSLNYAFTQVGSSAENAMSALEGFAKARRENPGVDALIQNRGLKTSGNATDVLTSIVGKLNEEHPYFAASKFSPILGISEDQFHTIAKNAKELKEYQAEYERTARLIGVDSSKTDEVSNSIAKSTRSLGMVLGLLGEKLFMALAPALKQIVQGFRDWVAANPDKVEAIMQALARALEALGKWLLSVGEWLSKDENQRKLVEFFTDMGTQVKAAAKEVKELLGMLIELGRLFGLSSTPGDATGMGKLSTKILNFLGIAPSGSGSGGGALGLGVTGGGGYLEGGGSAGGGGQKPGLIRRGWNAVKRAFGGDPGDMSGGKRSARSKGENLSGARESYEFWRSKGLSHEQAAGLVAMEEGESSFNPRARGDGGLAHGAFQHHPDRRAKILAATGINMSNSTHRQQLEATYWEMTEGQEKGFWDAIKRQTTPGAAAATGVYKFERPLDKAGEAARRGARANYWASVLGGSTEPAKPITAPRPSASPARMSPGGFSVDDYLRSQPLGSATTNNSTQKTVNYDAPVTIKIEGARDAESTGRAVGSAVSSLNQLQMRNVTSAVR